MTKKTSGPVRMPNLSVKEFSLSLSRDRDEDLNDKTANNGKRSINDVYRTEQGTSEQTTDETKRRRCVTKHDSCEKKTSCLREAFQQWLAIKEQNLSRASVTGGLTQEAMDRFCAKFYLTRMK